MRAISARYVRVVIAAVPGKLAALAMAVLLARKLGPAEFGFFVFAQGLATIVAHFAALGWPTLMLRMVPALAAENKGGELAAFLRFADYLLLASSLALAGVLLVGGWLGAGVGAGGELLESSLYAAVLVPTLAFRSLYRQRLAANGRPALAVTVDELLPALGVIALILLLPGASATDCLIASALAGMVALLVNRSAFDHGAQSGRPAFSEAPLKSWMLMGWFILLATACKVLLNRVDVVMLGPLSTLEATGLYGACVRLSYVLTFPQVALSMVLSPVFSSAYASGNQAELRQAVRQATRLSLVTLVPLALPFVLVPESVLKIVYGDSYAGGGDVLTLVIVSQFFASLSIPLSSLLMMTGREKPYGVLIAGVLALNVALNLLLIPPYGALGAAASSAVGMGFLLVAQHWLVRRSRFRLV